VGLGIVKGDIVTGATVKTLVTIGGECFDVECVRVGEADARDGTLYYFKVKDRLRNRGVRKLSIFATGTDKARIEHFDKRVQTACLNVLRRTFDAGRFLFEMPVDSDRYHELRMRMADFQPQEKENDETIRQFIKFGAYCLGFKCRPEKGSNLFVDFDCREDLDYLGGELSDIERNVWLLTEQGYLQKSAAATFQNPLRCTPTHILIDEIEKGHRSEPSRLIGANVTQNIHFHGDNSRLNLNSVDNSVNASIRSNGQLFIALREASNSVLDKSDRENILARLDELEKAQGSNGFFAAYQSFIASAAQYMTIFGPFIPALTQMLSGK
jgi:hypothetical protein